MEGERKGINGGREKAEVDARVGARDGGRHGTRFAAWATARAYQVWRLGVPIPASDQIFSHNSPATLRGSKSIKAIVNSGANYASIYQAKSSADTATRDE